MPGLLRGVARTAVIAGTATHVSNNVSRRQAQRWSADQPQQAEVAPVAETNNSDDMYIELQKLGELKAQGIITEEEFAAKKRQILGL